MFLARLCSPSPQSEHDLELLRHTVIDRRVDRDPAAGRGPIRAVPTVLGHTFPQEIIGGSSVYDTSLGFWRRLSVQKRQKDGIGCGHGVE